MDKQVKNMKKSVNGSEKKAQSKTQKAPAIVNALDAKILMRTRARLE